MMISFQRRIALILFLVPMFFAGSAFREYNPMDNMMDYVLAKGESKVSVDAFRSELVDRASKYVGSRYRSNGSSPKGFDCSGFTSFIFSHYGLQLERSSRNQSKVGKRIPIASVQPGDLLFFAVKGNVHHVGMVVKNEGNQLWMIHSSTSRGVVVEEVFGSDYWRRRLLLARDVVSDMVLPGAEEVSETESF